MRIGIDLGGSHVAIGLINNGQIIQKSECNFSKEQKENIQATIQEFIYKQIDVVLEKISIDEIEMIGISAPRKN